MIYLKSNVQCDSFETKNIKLLRNKLFIKEIKYKKGTKHLGNKPIYLDPSFDFNPSRIPNIMNPCIDICDNKYKTHLFLDNLNFNNIKSSNKNIFSYPYLIKDSYGSSGDNIFLIKNKDDQEKYHSLELKEENYFYQEFIQMDKVFDIRVLVTYDGSVFSYKRYAPKGEFKSNISIGGKAIWFRIPKKIEQQINKIIKEIEKKSGLKSFSFGFDFLLKGEEWLIIEINTCPGFSTVLKHSKHRHKFLKLIKDYNTH